MKLIAVGTSRFLLGFTLAGVETVLANEENILEKIQQEDAGVIILDEQLLDSVNQRDREKIETSISPVIIVLSDNSEQQLARLQRAIKSTLGVDV